MNHNRSIISGIQHADNSPSVSHGSIEDQLIKLNRRIWAIRADGNSFFKSIAIQLDDPIITHSYLRELVYQVSLESFNHYYPSARHSQTLYKLEALRNDDTWVQELRDAALAIIQDELNIKVILLQDCLTPVKLCSKNEHLKPNSVVVIVQDGCRHQYDATMPYDYNKNCKEKIKPKSKNMIMRKIFKPIANIKSHFSARKDKRIEDNYVTPSGRDKFAARCHTCPGYHPRPAAYCNSNSFSKPSLQLTNSDGSYEEIGEVSQIVTRLINTGSYSIDNSNRYNKCNRGAQAQRCQGSESVGATDMFRCRGSIPSELAPVPPAMCCESRAKGPVERRQRESIEYEQPISFYRENSANQIPHKTNCSIEQCLKKDNNSCHTLNCKPPPCEDLMTARHLREVETTDRCGVTDCMQKEFDKLSLQDSQNSNDSSCQLHQKTPQCSMFPTKEQSPLHNSSRCNSDDDSLPAPGEF